MSKTVYKAVWRDWKEGIELGFHANIGSAKLACGKHSRLSIEWKDMGDGVIKSVGDNYYILPREVVDLTQNDNS